VKNRPPQHAVLVPIEIPDDLIAEIPELPEGWNAYPHRPESRKVGDRWVEEGKSPAMFVPSAIIPAERNILINPNHGRFGEIRVGEAEPHAFDRRLFGLR
jgi:RES domain-containing protein